jgi:hypothetical protein
MKPDEQGLTLALDVRFGQLPVLPQKLLKELLPGIRRALFKLKRFSVRKMPARRKVSR